MAPGLLPFAIFVSNFRKNTTKNTTKPGVATVLSILYEHFFWRLIIDDIRGDTLYFGTTQRKVNLAYFWVDFLCYFR